jgi:hypothetical protein
MGGGMASRTTSCTCTRELLAGHTDNVRLGKDDKFHSNWELSTARAVKVTELLVEKGVRPSNLVAAGYGEYDPVVSNATKTGRQKNRRIEIILEPQLSKELAQADLAVANNVSHDVSVLLGTGSGSFQAAFNYLPAPSRTPWRWGISTAMGRPTSPSPTSTAAT